MAAVHGQKTIVTVAAADLSDWVTSADLNLEGDIASEKTLGRTFAVSAAGASSGKFGLAGIFDSAVGGPDETLVPLAGSDTAVTIVYKPDGVITRTFTAFCASYSETSPNGGLVAWKSEFVLATAPVNT